MEEFENIQGSILPYNHEEIEIVMKQLLIQNGMSDVMYEGSNVSQLTSIISYIISSLNVNTAINIQETILPLATKRMNILYGARQLGYEPYAIKSYIYELTLKPKYDETKTKIINGKEVIDTQDPEPRLISIVKNTKFTAGDKTYYYVGPTLANVIEVSNRDIQFINDPNQGLPADEILLKIPVVEGELTTYIEDEMLDMTSYTYEENGETKTKQDYLIPYTNVEDQYGLQVYLNNNFNEQWEKSDSFLVDESLDYNKNKFIRKENIILGYPTIFFEFAGFGNAIGEGQNIKVNVLQSQGENGAAEESIIIDDVVFSQEMEVIDQKIIQTGTGAESDEDIKTNATIFNNTGNRAVTRLDYIAITKHSPLVKEADAWGGEEELPQVKGEIWLSCTPSAQTRPVIEYNSGFTIDIGTPSKDDSQVYQKNWKNWYVTDENYDSLFEYLEVYKIMTMGLNYRHPLYINFDYNIDIVKYDISKSPKTVNTIVFNAINDYFVNSIESFESEYLNSNLQRILDTVLGYNAGVNIELKLTGTLCSDMIDKYYQDHAGLKYIITSLSWPYETLLNNSEILIDKLPLIDTPDFGFNHGSLSVNYSELNQDLSNPVRRAKIYYNEGSTSTIFGEYIVDIKKKNITLIFDFNWQDAEEIIFGPLVQDSYGDYRTYQYFDINYYPYDSNVVNIPFSKHKIPRLRNVNFVNN